jgi:hypothetical protein
MAMDWVAELAHGGLATLTIALSTAAEADGMLDASQGEEAVAAAEIVASALGDPHADLPEDAGAWIASNGAELTSGYARLARAAVGQVLGEDSELRDLWIEDAEDEEWPAAMEQLCRRLDALV